MRPLLLKRASASTAAFFICSLIITSFGHQVAAQSENMTWIIGPIVGGTLFLVVIGMLILGPLIFTSHSRPSTVHPSGTTAPFGTQFNLTNVGVDPKNLFTKLNVDKGQSSKNNKAGGVLVMDV